MKKFIAGFALLGFAVFASAQTITFDKTTIEYGNVAKGSDGHRFFKVTNTGDKPLIISKVTASCGCTTPEWSQDPILPGKSAQIKVGYNTQINGDFVKNIEVFSNDPENSRSVVYIKGKVDGGAAQAAEVAAPALSPAPAAVKAEALPAKQAKKAVKKS